MSDTTPGVGQIPVRWVDGHGFTVGHPDPFVIPDDGGEPVGPALRRYLADQGWLREALIPADDGTARAIGRAFDEA